MHAGRQVAVTSVTALLVLFGAACRTPPSLTASQPSADALAQAMLEAVARRDGAALRALALTEQEFRQHVWPELPAARAERNLPFSFVWGDLHQKSDARMNAMLAQHGGRRLELREVRFGGKTAYTTYTVHRDSALVVRDQEGRDVELKIAGSMLEKDGQWKVFSFVVDD